MKFFNMVFFTKEGKGVDPDQPQKRAFFRFWEVIWRKRFKLMGANLLYNLFNVFAVIIGFIIFFVALSFFSTMSGGSVREFFDKDPLYREMTYRILIGVLIFFTTVPIFSIGPFRSGFEFLMRSFAREEPVFLWTDFSTKARSNKKLSIKVSLINFLAGFFIMIDFALYLAFSMRAAEWGISNVFLFVVFLILMFAAIMLFMMNLYIYPMIVSVRVTTKQLYKNAMLFSLMKWFPNLLILLAEFVLIMIPVVLIQGIFWLILAIVLYLLIIPAFFGFYHAFYVYPSIKKYLIDDPNADQSADKANIPVSAPETSPQKGKFVDGRWVEEEE